MIGLIIGVLRKYATISISVNIMKWHHVSEVEGKKKVDCYLSGIATAVWIHIHQIKIVSLLKCNGADCSRTHTEHTHPLEQLLSHFSNVWFMFSSTELTCPLQLLRSLRSVCFSISAVSPLFPSLVPLFSLLLSLSPWLSHSLLRACPALALSKFYSWSVKKNNKKTSEENITTLQNMWPT